MTEALSWSFKGIDHETRDAARAAARRSGKSLADWLDDIIHEKADSDMRGTKVTEVDDDLAEPSSRRFVRSRALGRPERERGRWRKDAPIRRDALDSAPSGEFERERFYDERPRASAFRDSPARDRNARRDSGLDAKAIVDDAVAIFERRAAATERKTAKALAGLADLIESGHKTRSRLGDDLGTVIDRLGRIENRMASQPETASARPIRSALARLESRIDRISNDDRAAEFETTLAKLDRRLADIAARLDEDADGRRTQSARPAPAVAAAPQREPRPGVAARRPLADAIAEITERQRALEERSEGRGRAFASAQPVVAEPTAGAFGEIAGSIEAISQQLAAARQETRQEQSVRGEQQAAVAAQIDHLRRELDGVSRSLVDLAPRASVGAVEAALRELSERVETQRYFGVNDNVLAPVERLTADLHAIIRDLDPGRVVHDLYDEVKTLGDKLAARQVEGGADQAALDEISGQTREIHELLKAVARRPLPLEKLEAGLAALTSRVDELSRAGRNAAAPDIGELVTAIRSIVATETSGPFEAFERKLEGVAAKIDAVMAKSGGGGKRFDEINERIERVHKSLAARIDRNVVGVGVDIGQLEQLLTKLAKKIDTAIDPEAAHPAFDELGRKIEKLEERLHPQAGAAAKAADAEQFRDLAARIDFVHNELAERIEVGVRTRADGAAAQLAELVAQLAQKMDAALDPRADRAAFASLEQQIERLAERLDRSDRSVASFASIERTIGELLTRVEDTRGSTARAAELAARHAAQEALREAAASGPLQDALEKELAEIRTLQDESGQRTHETLAAVHETLERVVDRLAVFEDELLDLRKAPPIAAPSPRATEEAPPRRDPRAKAAAPIADLEEMLLEPGERRPRREQGAGRETARPGSVQADFIAAARRAAQQAAVDAQAAAQQGRGGKKTAAAERAPGKPAEEAETKAGASAFQARKRPLLLGLGALVLLVGAYQIFRVGVDTTAPIAPAVHVEPGDATGPEPAPKARPDVMAGAPAPSKESAPSAPPATTEPAPAAQPQAAAPPLASPLAKLPMLPAGSPGAGSFTQPPVPTVPTAGKIIAETVDPMPIGAIGPAAVPTAAPTRPDALAAVRELAATGDANAQFELGARYAEGRGLTRDPKAAFQWFEKAAGRGLAPAQYRLGSLYEKGIGVERDYAQARSWYQRAAQAGNARAMHNLAVLYAEGGEGKPDYVSAAEWFRKGAEYGVRDSQFNLAILYARGLGVTQSLAQSYLWFSAAAAQGDEDAGKKRDEVRARLDSKELAAAKALVDGFRAKQPEKAANDVIPPPGGWENVKAPTKPESKAVGKPKVSAL